MLKGGLQIYATEDPTLQEEAQTTVDRVLSSPSGFTGSLVAIDPSTGEVKAMVGGPGFLQSQYNIATTYPGRQAGLDVEGDHPRRRAGIRVLAERHRGRHLAVLAAARTA